MARHRRPASGVRLSAPMATGRPPHEGEPITGLRASYASGPPPFTPLFFDRYFRNFLKLLYFKEQ